MARVITIPIGPIFTGRPCRGIVHVVEQGDTLYNLGKRYHVSVAQIMFANPYVDVYNLQIGAELCIPVSIQPRERENQGEMNAGMRGENTQIEMRPEEEVNFRMGGMPSQPGMDSQMGGIPFQPGMDSRMGGMPSQPEMNPEEEMNFSTGGMNSQMRNMDMPTDQQPEEERQEI